MNTKNRQTNLYYAPAAVTYQLNSASEKIKHMVAFLYDTELNDVKVEMTNNGYVYSINITVCESSLPIFANELISVVEEQFTNYFGQFMIEHFHAEFDAVEDFEGAP
jgi:hypothetical protein